MTAPFFFNSETIDLLHTELYPKAKQTNHNCKTVILVPHMVGMWYHPTLLLMSILPHAGNKGS